MNLHSEWLETAVGQALLSQERAQVRAALQQVFGDHILQIGSWGEPEPFLNSARTRYQAVIDTDHASGVDAVVSHGQLAVTTDCVDAVFLPHTLEFDQAPHAVLREVHRVLRPDGHLVVLGFNPVSWWGLRHQFADRGFPPGVVRYISRRRITDWLSLLNLSVDRVTPIGLAQRHTRGLRGFVRRLGWFKPAYMVVATKESIPMTHVRPRIRPRAKLVSGLVNPTPRNAA